MEYNSAGILFAFTAGFALDLNKFCLYFVAVYLGYKLKKIIKIVIVTAILGIGCGLLAYVSPHSEENPPTAMWYSIIPPILAILLAFLTHHVLLSLGIALVAGGFLSAVPQDPLSIEAWLQGLRALSACVTDTVTSGTNLLILSFIPPIFIMIEIIIASGGFQGIILWLLKWIKDGRSAQLATAIMGVLCFIDDYANAIIVGSMMQPITDRFRVSREKLAFLVDATAAPVSGLAIVSTWIAYEVGLFADVARELGIERTGYSMFFDALSFRFYCLLMIAFMFVHIVAKRDFGPMKTAEKLAAAGNPAQEQQENTLVNAAGKDAAGQRGPAGRAVNALVPLGGLIIFHMSGLWIDGDGPAKLREGGSLLSWVYWREVISNAENSHLILLYAAVFGMVLALLCGLIFSSLRFPVICSCFKRGIKRAILPSFILVLAWSLKNCCDNLGTGDFLTNILADRLSPCMFPPILFIVASTISFATGTSWGTMAILIPTAIPIAFALDGQTYGLTTMISLGAVLDGAIFGDHCSPISDTTIMSATASSCELMRHVRTQLPYGLLIAVIALLFGYVPSALGLAPALCLILAILVIVILVIGLNYFLRTS
jgi:Na+/H+ antiporter NhaC